MDIKKKEEKDSSIFLNFYFYTLCLKFFVTTILIILYRNHLELLKPLAIITKQCFDFYLILILSLIFLSAFSSLIKKLNKEGKNLHI